MLRCPLCAGLNHFTLREEHLCCKLCSLAFKTGGAPMPDLDAYKQADDRFVLPNWNNWHRRAAAKLPSAGVGHSCYFAPLTVRMFAAREGRRMTQLDSTLPFLPIYAPWPFGKIIRAKIEPLPATRKAEPDARLTLGIIATLPAWDSALALCADMLDCAAEIIVVLDSADAAAAAARERELKRRCENRSGRLCRVISHPLNQNFAAQRNRIQQAARTDWVLQLDCDERLTTSSKRTLSHAIDEAEHESWTAVALTRRNMVDGVASALYPDVQYRLLRRSAFFTGTVHERPELNRNQRSFVCLRLEIVHEIASERLGQRASLYEEMQTGAGRLHDTALLRMPLQDGVITS